MWTTSAKSYYPTASGIGLPTGFELDSYEYVRAADGSKGRAKIGRRTRETCTYDWCEVDRTGYLRKPARNVLSAYGDSGRFLRLGCSFKRQTGKLDHYRAPQSS